MVWHFQKLVHFCQVKRNRVWFAFNSQTIMSQWLCKTRESTTPFVSCASSNLIITGRGSSYTVPYYVITPQMLNETSDNGGFKMRSECKCCLYHY